MPGLLLWQLFYIFIFFSNFKHVWQKKLRSAYYLLQKWPLLKPKILEGPLNYSCFSKRSLWKTKGRARLVLSFRNIFQNGSILAICRHCHNNKRHYATHHAPFYQNIGEATAAPLIYQGYIQQHFFGGEGGGESSLRRGCCNFVV